MKITNNYEVKQIADELLLVPKQDTYSSTALVLNKLASEIYKLIEENKTKIQIIETIMEKYDVDILVVKKDVADIINMFKVYNMVSYENEVSNC